MTNWIGAWVVAWQLAQQTPAPVATPPESPKATVSVSASVVVAAYPRRNVVELRPRVAVEATFRQSPAIEWRADAFVEGLAADRNGGASAAIARVREAWVHLGGRRADLRAGVGRLAWGRLDEIQPTDVINPIDAARFLLNGREDARLSVPLIRGRLFASEKVTLEGVLTPYFRRGRFDELDEETSPFNLLNDLVLPAGVSLSSSSSLRGAPPPRQTRRADRGVWPRAPTVSRRLPRGVSEHVSGGGRLTATMGRVDIGASVFRGRDGFGVITFEPDILALAPPGTQVVGSLVERFPRFTMVGSDMEMVAGDWALRGEAAVFVEKTFAGVSRPGLVDGRLVEAGFGADRRSGPYRVFASVVFRRQWSADDPAATREDATLIGSLDRTFGRDRWLVRGFVVINPADRSGFVRGLAIWRASDTVAVEASAGAFVGDGDDTLARFKGRDFVFTRLRYGW